ncbi:hypothetical protein VTH06DRAFT_3473 [Thermothelomyces fergusii]
MADLQIRPPTHHPVRLFPFCRLNAICSKLTPSDPSIRNQTVERVARPKNPSQSEPVFPRDYQPFTSMVLESPKPFSPKSWSTVLASTTGASSTAGELP